MNSQSSSNASGVAYADAHLQLVAGNVNVVTPAALGAIAKSATEAEESGVPRVTQENYFEYHLYTLSRPTTIINNQTKQVTLLVAHSVPIRKTLELRGSPSYRPRYCGSEGARLRSPYGVSKCLSTAATTWRAMSGGSIE